MTIVPVDDAPGRRVVHSWAMGESRGGGSACRLGGMWKLVQEHEAGQPGARRSGAGRPGRRAGASRTVTLVSADPRVADQVAPAVAGAGLELEVVESGDASAVATAGTAATGAQQGVAQRCAVLWDAQLLGQLPADAVLVGIDEELLWARAARSPGHRSVVLPQGRGWLAQYLGAVGAGAVGPRGDSGQVVGGQSVEGQGRVIAVCGVGEAACPDRVAVLVASASAKAGLRTVLVDAHGVGGIAAAVSQQAAEESLVGWNEASRSVRDGSPHGLIAALPLLGGSLGGGVGGIPVLAGGVRGTSPGDRARLIEVLTLGCDVVVAALGCADPNQWWDSTGSLGELSCVVQQVVAVGAGPLPRPAPDRLGMPAPDLVTVRGLGRTPDGPDTADRLGAAWAGTVDVKHGRMPGATSRLIRRRWSPRLAAGEPLGWVA